MARRCQVHRRARGAPGMRGVNWDHCENRLKERSTETQDVINKIWHQKIIPLETPVTVDPSHLEISGKSPRGKGNKSTPLSFTPKHFYDFRHVFFLRRDKRQHPGGRLHSSSGYLSVYILSGTLILITRPYLTILRQHGGVCADLLLILTDLLCLLWCYCVIDLQKAWKETSSSPGCQELNFKLFTWNKFVGMRSHLQYLLWSQMPRPWY